MSIQNLEVRQADVNLLKNRRTSAGTLPLFKTLSARELFPVLNRKRLDSRPVIGQDRGPFKLDKTGRKRYLGKPTPIFGAPTFRNVIVEGRHI